MPVNMLHCRRAPCTEYYLNIYVSLRPQPWSSIDLEEDIWLISPLSGSEPAAMTRTVIRFAIGAPGCRAAGVVAYVFDPATH